MLEGRKLNLNTIPPEQMQAGQEQDTGTPPAEVSQTQQVVPPTVVDEPPQAPTEPPKVDEFIENLNKRFGTQFKADEEVKNIFGLPKKVSEYETRLKESESLAKSIENYKKKIEELEKDQDPLKYFSSPDTYIAEQLRIKYPKSNPVLLQEIATSDVDAMEDFDVLVKEKQLFIPKLSKEGDIRGVLFKRYGIDPDTPPQEWDSVVKTEIAMDAASARDRINELKKGIEMPKIVTREQREKEAQELLNQKEEALKPLKETFSKFDKFTYEGFEFDVPDEYKSKLPDMFQSMFIEAGLEPNEENMASALELREALLLKQYFTKIKEVIAKEAETKLQAKIDAELHNTQPPNMATATDDTQANTLPGLSKFLSDQKAK